MKAWSRTYLVRSQPSVLHVQNPHIPNYLETTIFVTFWGMDERKLISHQIGNVGIRLYRWRLCIASSSNVYIINEIQWEWEELARVSDSIKVVVYHRIYCHCLIIFEYSVVLVRFFDAGQGSSECFDLSRILRVLVWMLCNWDHPEPPYPKGIKRWNSGLRAFPSNTAFYDGVPVTAFWRCHCLEVFGDIIGFTCRKASKSTFDMSNVYCITICTVS